MIAKRNLPDSVAWLRGHGSPPLQSDTREPLLCSANAAARTTARKPLINRRLSEGGAHEGGREDPRHLVGTGGSLLSRRSRFSGREFINDKRSFDFDFVIIEDDIFFVVEFSNRWTREIVKIANFFGEFGEIRRYFCETIISSHRFLYSIYNFGICSRLSLLYPSIILIFHRL